MSGLDDVSWNRRAWAVSAGSNGVQDLVRSRICANAGLLRATFAPYPRRPGGPGASRSSRSIDASRASGCRRCRMELLGASIGAWRMAALAQADAADAL
jgi:hypothetical protein